MAFFIRKDTAQKVIAHSPLDLGREQFDAWINTLRIEPMFVEDDRWVVYFGGDRYTVLSEAELEFEYAPYVAPQEQGGFEPEPVEEEPEE